MGSAKAAQTGIGALLLLLAVIVGFRVVLGERAPSVATSAPAMAPVPGASPAPLNLSAPAGSLALSWVQLLSRESANPNAGAAEQELIRSEERQITQELKSRLGKDPTLWTDVLEVLSAEDPRPARKIVAALPDAVGSAGEPVLVRLLQSAQHREVRKSAATLIGPRTSTETFFALVSAAQQDADSGVRYQALTQLTQRRGQATPAEAATIDQTLRLRAQVEPDPDVRNFALRVTGQPAPSAAGVRRK